MLTSSALAIFKKLVARLRADRNVLLEDSVERNRILSFKTQGKQANRCEKGGGEEGGGEEGEEERRGGRGGEERRGEEERRRRGREKGGREDVAEQREDRNT